MQARKGAPPYKPCYLRPKRRPMKRNTQWMMKPKGLVIQTREPLGR